MPSSLVGAAITIALFAPGLAYVLRHERVLPARSHTELRETLQVVFASIVCLAITGLLAAALRWALPKRTPDFRRLVQNPSQYALGHYVQLIWWSVGLLAAATIIGAVLADRRVIRALMMVSRWRPIRWIAGQTKTSISSVSAWYRVFHLFDEETPGPIHIAVALDDGTVVEGRLFTFNVASEDNEDRDMVLSAPISLTTVDGVRHILGSQFTVISARHIVRLDVTHLYPGGPPNKVAPIRAQSTPDNKRTAEPFSGPPKSPPTTELPAR